MPYVLNKGVYSVRCRHPQCPFVSHMEIEANIMGVTETDVESEAIRLAKDMALSKHDSMHGRRHTLTNPDIRRVSGSYQQIPGITQSTPSAMEPEVTTREFQKGEVILKKGDAATTVCEVVCGQAYPERNNAHRYTSGDCFGAAALLARHRRMANIISANDGTRVRFYDLVALRRRDPRKASWIFLRVMEDALTIISELERSVDRYKKHAARAAAV